MTSAPTAYLALPSPISTNELFANVPGKGRIKTKKYNAWCKLASQYLSAQLPLPAFTVPVDIVLYVGESGVGGMDSDNTPKALIDAIKEAGVIKDDSRKWVRSSNPIWVAGLQGSVVVVRPAREGPHADVVASMLSRAGRDLVLVRQNA